MQDYLTVCPATISLSVAAENGEQRKMLQETMVTLCGSSNLRREANASSGAVVQTVTPGRHGPDRRVERVRVADISDCLGDGINIRSA